MKMVKQPHPDTTWGRWTWLRVAYHLGAYHGEALRALRLDEMHVREHERIKAEDAEREEGAA
jgi:hypothetical protein